MSTATTNPQPTQSSAVGTIIVECGTGPPTPGFQFIIRPVATKKEPRVKSRWLDKQVKQNGWRK